MSKIQKLIERLRGRPSDFTWSELVTLLRHHGYQQLKGSGSRRKFYRPDTGHKIFLHEPHPSPVLKAYQVEEAIQALTDAGIIPKDDE